LAEKLLRFGLVKCPPSGAGLLSKGSFEVLAGIEALVGRGGGSANGSLEMELMTGKLK
jgi:hypothetical protein